jgi:hypothetical protein
MNRPLNGVIFHCRSEPLSRARRDLIEAVGATALTDYASMEITEIGFSCPDAIDADDSHLCSSSVAAIERQRPLFDGGPDVDALLLTTLSPNAPKIALNAELGDSARIEERDCPCTLGSLGLRTHLSQIRSFEKLSPEGTTFARSNLIQILEDVLPARFGGTALDYQVVEESARDSATLLVLRINPTVGPVDEDAVRSTLLRQLSHGGFIDKFQASLLESADSIVVRRLEPLATRAGKVLPFQLGRHAEAERVRV